MSGLEWIVSWLQVNAHVGSRRHYRVCSSRHTFPRPRKSFEYIRLYNQSVPVCSILSAGKIKMSVQAVHLHFFLSSIPHSIDAVSAM